MLTKTSIFLSTLIIGCSLSLQAESGVIGTSNVIITSNNQVIAYSSSTLTGPAQYLTSFIGGAEVREAKLKWGSNTVNFQIGDVLSNEQLTPLIRTVFRSTVSYSRAAENGVTYTLETTHGAWFRMATSFPDNWGVWQYGFYDPCGWTNLAYDWLNGPYYKQYVFKNNSVQDINRIVSQSYVQFGKTFQDVWNVPPQFRTAPTLFESSSLDAGPCYPAIYPTPVNSRYWAVDPEGGQVRYSIVPAIGYSIPSNVFLTSSGYLQWDGLYSPEFSFVSGSAMEGWYFECHLIVSASDPLNAVNRTPVVLRFYQPPIPSCADPGGGPL